MVKKTMDLGTIPHPEPGEKYFYVRPDYSVRHATCTGWWWDFEEHTVYAWMEGDDGLREMVHYDRVCLTSVEANMKAMVLKTCKLKYCRECEEMEDVLKRNISRMDTQVSPAISPDTDEDYKEEEKLPWIGILIGTAVGWILVYLFLKWSVGATLVFW